MILFTLGFICGCTVAYIHRNGWAVFKDRMRDLMSLRIVLNRDLLKK